MKTASLIAFMALFSAPVLAQASNSTNAAPAQSTQSAGPSAQGTAPQPAPARHCIVLKRMGPADEVTSHVYSFGIRGKQFQYVEGELPPGVKFHGRLTDSDVRDIQKKGGHVVIMEPKYTQADLKTAKESCEQGQD